MESTSQEKFEGIPRTSRINQLQESSSSQQNMDQGKKELEHHMHEGPSNPDPDPSSLNNKPTTQQVFLPQTTSATSIRYRECLKNHAASTGGHIFDGCGEFMPSGEEGTPEALQCAACNCHRNFHRKAIPGASNPLRHGRNQTPTMLPQQHHYRGPVLPRLMVAIGGNVVRAPAESSSEDLNQGLMQGPSSKKRFRTKFTQQQKHKMQEFAEKIGWRIQKQDDQEVKQFCSEVGVKRQVFKVWMHNSKQAEKKRQM